MRHSYRKINQRKQMESMAFGKWMRRLEDSIEMKPMDSEELFASINRYLEYIDSEEYRSWANVIYGIEDLT